MRSIELGFNRVMTRVFSSRGFIAFVEGNAFGFLFAFEGVFLGTN